MAIPLHGSWLMSALVGPDEAAPRWRRGASDTVSARDETLAAPRDAALVARLRAGEAAAFTELLEDVVPALVEYAGRLVPHGTDAEDLVQDVLARVWIARSTLVVATSVRAYLFVAVRNSAHNARKHRRVAAAYGEAARVHMEWGVLDPATVLVGRVTVEQLLAHLSERRREALMLRYLGGLSFAEVAQVLGTTRVNAERLVARALETLRRLATGDTPEV
jgi:RNA polymerase sigma-70 factor (ECF subfamily)